MKKSDIDTIFSLATLPGRSGVAVFRVSGPQASEIAREISGANLLKPRLCSLRTFKSRDKTPIDQGLQIYMPGPGSFTGEDCLELQTHGSLAVIEAMSAALYEAGARQAEAGEFTRRAFENGRMDLTEAEGLADLIDAETEGQRIQALRQMRGGLKTRYTSWRESLFDALAQIEGEIDFPDEADIPNALAHKAFDPLNTLALDMTDALSDFRRGERVRHGLDIAIIGAPNAGKSSIINNLAQREAAIVTDIAGTTRDIVDVNMDVAGLPVRISDTAGLRESEDIIEAEGIRRGLERARACDVRILVHDARDPVIDLKCLNSLKAGDFVLLNKSDLAQISPHSLAVDVVVMAVSAKTGEGMLDFKTALERAAIERFSPSQNAGLTRMRHKECVERGLNAVNGAIKALGVAPELAGDDIRAALQALRELSGEMDIEAVFDRIFSRFCVGK